MDVFVVVSHDRHTDDSYTIVKGYDNAKKVAEDLARSSGYVDDNDNLVDCPGGYGYYGWGEDYYIDIVKPKSVIGFN